MAYFNRTGVEYYVKGDAGLDIDTRRQSEPADEERDGLYYRQAVFSDLAAQLDARKDGQDPYETLTLNAVQAWNERGWKQSHASAAAAERFSDKMVEEQHEIDDALEDYWSTGSNTELIKELGDYLWCATAVASNSGIVIDDFIKQRLYDYAVGTKVMNDKGAFVHPEWYDAAATLSIKPSQLTLEDFDDLMLAGFVPRFSPAMNLYDTEEISPTAYVFDFMMYAATLKVLSGKILTEPERFFAGNRVAAANDIGKIVAEVYFRVAAIAYEANSSLSEVVAANVDKIDHRIAHNLVDKTDGDRTASLTANPE